MPFHSQLLVPLAAKVVLGFGLSVLSSFSILLSPLPSHGASPTQNDEDHRQIWSLLTFEIQHALQEIGLYHGPLDGFANPDLLASVLKYQESQGLPQDGIVTQELLDHLRIDGRSNKLLSDLAEQKKRNQDTARESLLAQEETKDLLALKPTEDISDAARDKDRCLTMPTVTCLIDEALESAKAVNKAEYRRWVYREVMKAQTYAGMDSESRQTIRRLEDPRLMLVALQEQVQILVQVGRIADALNLAESIPTTRIKAKALSAIYIQRPNDPSIAQKFKRQLTQLEAPLDLVDLATNAAIFLWQKEAYQPATELLTLAQQARKEISVKDTAQSADLLILSAETKMGRIKALKRATEYYEDQKEYRYLVITLSDLALLYHLAGQYERAHAALNKATQFQKQTKGFPAQFTLAKLAETEARMNSHSQAVAIADRIEKASLRARTYWILANLKNLPANNSSIRADYLRRTLAALKEMTNDFDKISLLSQIVLRQLELNQEDRARRNFNSAIKLAHDLRNNWWRARAFSRLAMIRAVLEKRAKG